MGLQFTVGNPSEVFLEEYAERVRSTFVEKFGEAVIVDSPEPLYRSDECGWSGWSMLQKRAKRALGAKRIPHLLCMEAWNGCYVPTDAKPGAFFRDGKTPLDVGSLPALISELDAIGNALDLPLDAASLETMVCDCVEDDEMDVQVYAALFLAARVAQRRKQPLWVVK